MIKKLTKKVQQDRGITFKPTITQYRPPVHTQSLKKMIHERNGNDCKIIDLFRDGSELGSHSDLLSEKDLISRPYYPAANTLQYYTK